MTSAAEIESRIKHLVRHQFGISSTEEITNAWSFKLDGEADDLDQLEMIMGLEEAFDLCISDEEGEAIQTVQQAINYVKERS